MRPVIIARRDFLNAIPVPPAIRARELQEVNAILEPTLHKALAPAPVAIVVSKIRIIILIFFCSLTQKVLVNGWADKACVTEMIGSGSIPGRVKPKTYEN